MRVPTLRLLVPLLVATLAPALAWSQSAEVRASGAVDVAVLVNTGEGSIADIRHGLVNFFDAIRVPHEVALAGLSRPMVQQPYTSDIRTFTHSVNTLYLRGVSGAYASMTAAAFDALRTLQTRAPSRRAIIVVSDGDFPGDTALRNKRDALRTALQANGVTLYGIMISASQAPYSYPSGNSYIKPLVSVPDVVPKASGGRVVYVLASSGVPAALAGIARDINQQ